MANSGPGWEGIDVAWDWMQYDREYEREQARREREAAERQAEQPPP